MFKLILLITVVSFTYARVVDSELQSYCGDRSSYADCEDDVNDNGWFKCRWSRSQGECVSAFENMGYIEEIGRAKVCVSSDYYDCDCKSRRSSNSFIATGSFDSTPEWANFDLQDIRSICQFENIARVQVAYDCGDDDNFFPNEMNKQPDSSRSYDDFRIIPMPKFGCAIFFEDSNFYGSSVEICEGNWYNAENINFSSFILGEGCEVQFWYEPSNPTQNRRFLGEIAGVTYPQNVECFRDPNEPTCHTFRHSLDYFYYGEYDFVTSNVSYIVLCSNKSTNRCFDNPRAPNAGAR